MAAYTRPGDSPSSYADHHHHRASGTFDPSVPPRPPPKPRSADVSRQGTPVTMSPPQFSQPPPAQSSSLGPVKPSPPTPERPSSLYAEPFRPPQDDAGQQAIPDPGPNWLPKILQDKSIQDLQHLLHNPTLLSAACHAHTTVHPSTTASTTALQHALAENIRLATHLNAVEARLAALRASTQTQLLSAHALERQWRQKQADMDRALTPFAPASLYQRLGAGVADQEMVCRALEECFLEDGGGGGGGGGGEGAGEREVAEWVRRYRDARRLYYSRREGKERWDEGRVGGWR